MSCWSVGICRTRRRASEATANLTRLYQTQQAVLDLVFGRSRKTKRADHTPVIGRRDGRLHFGNGYERTLPAVIATQPGGR
jgi:hypothetical protein